MRNSPNQVNILVLLVDVGSGKVGTHSELRQHQPQGREQLDGKVVRHVVEDESEGGGFNVVEESDCVHDKRQYQHPNHKTKNTKHVEIRQPSTLISPSLDSVQ